MSFSFRLARQVVPEESCPIKNFPDETCPTKLDRKAEARQQPSTGADLQGSCVLVGQESIPDGNSCDEHSFGTPGSRSDIDLVPPKGKRRRTSQPDEMVVVNPAFPFSEAPINMLNMTWAEKGKGKITREEEEERLAKRPTEGIIKPPEYPKAAIIKGLVMCSKCQCECELEIPPAGILIDHELIRRKEEDTRRETREKIKHATRKDTSRSVFQRSGGDSQPKALSEVFRNHEASDEAENMEAKIQKGADHPQNGQMGGEVKRTDGIANPGRKGNLAHLGRKWYVIGKDG
ncbi:hypothetical protein ACFX12_023746 [Malus domestica]